MAYAALSPRDREEMLRLIGASSVEDLFADIPAALRDGAAIPLGEPQSELQVLSALQGLAHKNSGGVGFVSFRGAGSYDHYVPALVNAITSRGEFSTAYTPYQAESSQGTLQVIYEFQSLLCRLTGMELSNASLYDGATALAEALIMAMAIRKSKRIVLPRTLSPSYRRVVETYLQGLDAELVEIPWHQGQLDTDALQAALQDNTAAVVLQQPNFLGCLEPAEVIADLTKAAGALLVAVYNPATLGYLPPPGAYGADIAVAEGQPLGLAQSLGGPGVGLFSCRQSYARMAPGRLVGATHDSAGRRGFTLTLQTREQHIRREKATSNICTNQALCALTATVYLSTLGAGGLRAVAEQCHAKAHYLAGRLAALPGVEPLWTTPFFHEFAVRLTEGVPAVNERLLQAGMLGGVDLGHFYPELQNTMLLCCTEKRTREEMDRLVEVMEGRGE